MKRKGWNESKLSLPHAAPLELEASTNRADAGLETVSAVAWRVGFRTLKRRKRRAPRGLQSRLMSGSGCFSGANYFLTIFSVGQPLSYPLCEDVSMKTEDRGLMMEDGGNDVWCRIQGAGCEACGKAPSRRTLPAQSKACGAGAGSVRFGSGVSVG